MPSSLLFGELNALNTPRSTNQPPPLNTKKALAIQGRLAEGLMHNDSVTIPLRGPALEVVTLITILGERRFRDLVAGGVLRFIFCPGQLAYISERNRRMGIKAGPGLTWLTSPTSDFRDPIAAVKVALTEQLGVRSGKAHRLAQTVEHNTKVLDAQAIFDRVEELSYPSAFKLLADELELKSPDDFLRFDNDRDNPQIRKLLDVAHAHLDIICAAHAECPHILGNEMTWRVLENSTLPPSAKESRADARTRKIAAIFKLEGVPDIPALVLAGFPLPLLTDLRMGKDVIRFRELVDSLPDGNDEQIKEAYRRALRNLEHEGKKILLKRKAITLGIIQLASLGVELASPGVAVATAFDLVTSCVDLFWGDKLLGVKNPKLFIEKTLKYLDKQQVLPGEK